MPPRVRGLRAAVALGPRLFLRRPTAKDRDEFLTLMRASRALHHPWVWPPTTPGPYEAYLRRIRRRNAAGFVACRRADGIIVGVVNLSEIVRNALDSAYLGYYVGAPYARHGYMREALQLALRHAFTSIGLHRLEANIEPDNTASLALARACGFRREGFSPRYLRIGGEWRDHERWAMVAEDWRATQS